MSHSQPHSTTATPSLTQLYPATTSLTQPHTASNSHTQPQTASHSHTQSHPASNSHTQPHPVSPSFKQPHTATHSLTQPNFRPFHPYFYSSAPSNPNHHHSTSPKAPLPIILRCSKSATPRRDLFILKNSVSLTACSCLFSLF